MLLHTQELFSLQSELTLYKKAYDADALGSNDDHSEHEGGGGGEHGDR